MLGLAIDGQRIAAPTGQHVLEGGFGIERSAALIEHGELKPRAEPHSAAIGLNLAGQHADQRRFARAIGTDDADPAAAHDARRKIVDHHPLAKRLVDIFGLDDHGARTAPLGHRHFYRALWAAIILDLLAQAAQQIHAPHIALAAGGDAIANPVFLGSDLARQLVLFLFLLLEEIIAPGFKHAKALIDAPGLPPVDPHSAAREIGEKPAVVADEHQGRAQRFEFAFQPFDGRQIEMVGWLVQQQNVGFRRKHAGQRGATGLSAR